MVGKARQTGDIKRFSHPRTTAFFCRGSFATPFFPEESSPGVHPAGDNFLPPESQTRLIIKLRLIIT